MNFHRFGSRYLLHLERGEEIVTSLKLFCTREEIHRASLVGLGTVSRVTLGLFRTGACRYLSDELPGTCAAAPLTGTVTAEDGRYAVQCRINLDTVSGYLNAATVCGECDIVLEVSSQRLDCAGPVPEAAFSFAFAA